jgi:NhaD family Na+/H+ antiporter
MLYISLILVFSLGYFAIILEKKIQWNRGAVALVMSIILWGILFWGKMGIPSSLIAEEISDTAQIVFFLLAAMAIVELIDSHRGFSMITGILYGSSDRKLLWFLLVTSFFMSSVIDNLTTTIVMVALIRKLVEKKENRWLIGSLIVIAVNAGGAWTPIGDVTTTMLWINERISTFQTIKTLFLPSFVNLIVVGGLGSFLLKSEESKKKEAAFHHLPMEVGAKRIFFSGIGALLLIPVLKGFFHLPPFMGALLGLGALWIMTDIIHVKHGEARCHLRVPHILSKIDSPGVLFFLGILLAVDALTASGLLRQFAQEIGRFLPTPELLAVFLGLISSVIDNVPLVAATFGMYDLATYPIDSSFWLLTAYGVGTGGSIFIIGSAAGIVLMGLEKVDFFWYLKKVSWIAVASYFSGVGVYLLTH